MSEKKRPVRPFKVRFTKSVRNQFLKILQEGFSESHATKELGLSYPAYQRWRTDKPKWKKKVEEAQTVGITALEDEVVRRGKKGYLKPLVSGGKVVGYAREYSDGLLKMSVQAKSKTYAPSQSTGAHLEPAIAGAAAQLLDRLAALVEEADRAERDAAESANEADTAKVGRKKASAGVAA